MATLPSMDTTSLQLVEQGSTPSTPAATKQRLFIRSSDHLLCTVDSSGTVTPWGGALTNPMTTAEDIIKGGVSGAPARLAKGSAGGALSIINAAVAWNSGTSFPGSKATGDRYWRTDLGMEFYWDGTQWASTALHQLELISSDQVNPHTTTSQGVRGGIPVWGGSDILLVSTWTTVFIAGGGTALSASHKWVGVLAKQPAGTTLDTISFASGASSVYRQSAVTTINAVLTLTNLEIDVFWTKTGTPGNLYETTTAISYRYVAV